MINASLNHCITQRTLRRGSLARRLTQLLAVLLLAAFACIANAGKSPNTPNAILNYDDGDLFLGFRSTDGTSDYLINIGQPTQFLTASPGASFQVDVGTASADLVTTFGSDWYTRIDTDTGNNAVLWAVTGGRQVVSGGDPANVLYSTNPVVTPWASHSVTAQSFTSSLTSALGNTFAGNNSTANNVRGLVQSAASNNSYASFQPPGANSGGISFQAWNPSNEGSPANTLYLNRIAPGACATVLGTLTLNSSGQVNFTATLTPPPVNLSGGVTNCSTASPVAVPNVVFTLTGSASASTQSDGAGGYTFSSLPSGGNFVVTPTKTAVPPAGSGINNVDVLAVQRHFLGIAIIPAGCRLTAADCAGSVGVNGQDVLALQRFFLGFSTGTGNVGKYQFSPVSRNYPGIFCSKSGENFSAIVLGDVASPFISRPAGPAPDASGGDTSASELVAKVTEVGLPDVAVDQLAGEFVIPVTTTAINAQDKFVGFQGDFSFDERVVSFQSEPVQKAGVTGGNWNVAGNVLPGKGPIRTLRVAAFSNDFAPLSGAGSLFELRVAGTSSKAGQGTQLIWANPPDDFIFIDADLNTHKPALATPGGITIEKVANKEEAQR